MYLKNVCFMTQLSLHPISVWADTPSVTTNYFTSNVCILPYFFTYKYQKLSNAFCLANFAGDWLQSIFLSHLQRFSKIGSVPFWICPWLLQKWSLLKQSWMWCNYCGWRTHCLFLLSLSLYIASFRIAPGF